MEAVTLLLGALSFGEYGSYSEVQLKKIRYKEKKTR